MSELSGALDALLQNPGLLKAAVGALCGGRETAQDDRRDTAAVRRRALCSGIRPYLSKDRQSRLDAALAVCEAWESFSARESAEKGGKTPCM